MTATEVVFFGVFAAFNACIAILIGGVRPRRLPNLVAAAMFASNAVASALQAFQVQGAIPPDVMDRVNIALNVVVFAAFLVFPFVFPRRRLSPRRERWLLAGATGWVATVVAGAVLAGAPVMVNHPFYVVNNVLSFTPFHAALSLGAVLLLDHYLTTPSDTQRRQAAYILAAYVLKMVGSWSTLPPFQGPPTNFPEWQTPMPLLLLNSAILAAGLLAVPLGLASSRWRNRTPGLGRRRDDALLVALMGGIAFFFLFMNNATFGHWDYYLVRPFLFAYAILGYQLLEVDVRERRGLVGATLLAGMAGVFIAVVTSAQLLGVDPAVATALGFVATIGAVGLLTWPLVQWLIAPAPGAHEQRDRELYRAALEEAVAATTGHDSTQDRVLRALRAKLQISDREHAVLEAAVRASFGKPADGVATGQRFLGRYRVEQLLGEGGFGRTFLALDEHVGRKVVLKAARIPDPEEARRLLREARVVAKLQHPNVVTVFDVEQVAGDVVLVMEYVEGGSLADRLRRGALKASEAAPLVEDMLSALEAAHAKGIVHRDLKPANVLLTPDGRAKLADFGVARAPAGTGTISGGSMTNNGAQPGSLHYMSPEQVRGKAVDARSDLYSLGVVWYEMLAGQPYLNFRGRAEFDARLAILEETPKLPVAGAPREVNQVLAELLAKEPARRPGSAAELRRRIAQRARAT